MKAPEPLYRDREKDWFYSVHVMKKRLQGHIEGLPSIDSAANRRKVDGKMQGAAGCNQYVCAVRCPYAMRQQKSCCPDSMKKPVTSSHRLFRGKSIF